MTPLPSCRGGETTVLASTPTVNGISGMVCISSSSDLPSPEETKAQMQAEKSLDVQGHDPVNVTQL